MTYQEVLEQARGAMGPHCKACPVCNGLACKNSIPGPGAKGIGTGFIRNYQKWQELCVNMDTICENAPVDTSFTLFGRTVDLPVFAAPVGAMTLHYGDKYDDLAYNDILVAACAKAGIAAFTGDGTDPAVMEGAAAAIAKNGGYGVPTIKPWNLDTIRQKMDLVKAADPFAIAMDIDAAGLPFLKNMTPPAGSKTVEELRQIVEMAGKPFIVKGVMTVAGARKALEAGAKGIVVSNHGGRVLDQCPATAEVLPAIVDAVGGKMTVLVDGGIRTGMDVFKALALGADAVLIGRPFVTMVYGAGAEGVQAYVDKLKAELADTMAMCGAHSLADINRSMLYGYCVAPPLSLKMNTAPPGQRPGRRFILLLSQVRQSGSLPAVHCRQLVRGVEPVLPVLLHRQAAGKAGGEGLHGLPVRQMVPAAVQDGRGRRPPADGVCPDVLQVFPGEGLAEVGGDGSLPGQPRLGDAGPAHHLSDEGLHVHHRGEEQCPRQRRVRICQQAEPGPQAGAEESRLVPPVPEFRQNAPQLRHHPPGHQVLRFRSPLPVAGQVDAHGLPARRLRRRCERGRLRLAAALAVDIQESPPAGRPPPDGRHAVQRGRPGLHLRTRTGRRSRRPPGPGPPSDIRFPAGRPPSAAPGPGWPPCCS